MGHVRPMRNFGFRARGWSDTWFCRGESADSPPGGDRFAQNDRVRAVPAGPIRRWKAAAASETAAAMRMKHGRSGQK
jgi:hypothetical protein